MWWTSVVSKDARQGHRLRKDGGPLLDQPVQGLGKENDRDAQPCLLDEVALNLVGPFWKRLQSPWNSPRARQLNGP